MSILKVARLGHPVLRARALPVPPSDISRPPIQSLIDDMVETMREYSGIGLAAPQVHVGLRLFVAGIRVTDAESGPDDREDTPLIVLINPELTLSTEPPEAAWEGCLSIPDIRGLVPRAAQILVRAYDRTGRRIEFSAKGLPGRVIQHETDHLDGRLFFDRMPTLDSLTFMDEFHRYWRKDDDDQ